MSKDYAQHAVPNYNTKTSEVSLYSYTIRSKNLIKKSASYIFV